MDEQERQCGICGRVKPVTEFSQHFSYCKVCDAVYGGAWDASGHEQEWPGRLREEPYLTMVRWAAEVGASGRQLRELGRQLAQAWAEHGDEG